MGDINFKLILGYVGKDPEIKQINGTVVANFSVATAERWKDRSTGEWKEWVEWHRVVAWGKLAQVVDAQVNKGSRIMVECKQKTQVYKKPTGETVYNVQSEAKTIEVLDKPRSMPQGDPADDFVDDDVV